MSSLIDGLGTPVLMAYGMDSDGDAAASDNDAGVSILGTCGVLLFAIGDAGVAESETATIQFQYSSTGSASDAATSNAGMTCTDAVLTFSTTSSNAAIQTVYFDTARKNIQDGPGKLYCTVTGEHSDNITVVGIPVIGTGTLPVFTPTVRATA